MLEVSIELTHECPLGCIFCSSSAVQEYCGPSLSLDAVGKILASAKKLGAQIVSLSGGEPFIRKDIFEIIRACRRFGLQTYLYTSGVCRDAGGQLKAIPTESWRQVSEIAGSGFKAIFDLQSHTKSMVETLNGVDNSFEIIIESIKNAASCNIDCESHFIPLKQNYAIVDEVIEFSFSIGISRVSILRFVPQGRGFENRAILELCEEESATLLDKLYSLVQLYGDRVRLGHPIDFLFTKHDIGANCSCRGGADAPVILPSGEVHMCPAWKQLPRFTAGSIHEQSLEDIWEHSPFYTAFRNLAKLSLSKDSGCNLCPHVQQCNGGCIAQRILASKMEHSSFSQIFSLPPDPFCPLVMQGAKE